MYIINKNGFMYFIIQLYLTNITFKYINIFKIVKVIITCVFNILLKNIYIFPYLRTDKEFISIISYFCDILKGKHLNFKQSFMILKIYVLKKASLLYNIIYFLKNSNILLQYEIRAK